jgi:endonuclease/exonuclease/phosphatase family metal-dependent hydrolase
MRFFTITAHALLSLAAVMVLVVPHLDPRLLSWAGFMGFAVPFVLFAAAAWAVVLLLLRSWYALFPLLVLVAGFPSLRSTIGIPVSSQSPSEDIRIVTFNTKFFNSAAVRSGLEKDLRAENMKQVSELQADLLLLQEAYEVVGIQNLQLTTLLKRNGYQHVLFEESVRGKGSSKYERTGLVIASRFPLLRTGVLAKRKRDHNKIVWADVQTKWGTFRVYNVHLISNSLRQEQVLGLQVRTEDKPKWGALYRTMRDRFLQRANQLDGLLTHMATSQYPVLVAGDCNEVPYGYVYNKLKEKGLENAHEKAGKGIGATYHGWLPYLRIDLVFATDSWHFVRSEVIKDIRFSDHFPVYASLRRTSNSR